MTEDNHTSEVISNATPSNVNEDPKGKKVVVGQVTTVTQETFTAEIGEETTPNPDTYHKPEALFRIAIWSGWVGWAFLLVALVNFGLRVYNNYYPLFAAGQAGAQQVMYMVINEAYTILFMVFVFLVLQGVSQGSYMLMDLFEKSEQSSK